VFGKAAVSQTQTGGRPAGRPQAGVRLRALVSPSPPSVTTAVPEPDLFTRSAQQYTAGRFGRQIAVLLAGAATAPGDLGVDRLRADGADVTVSLIDDGGPVTLSAVAGQAGLSQCVLGDLRAAALPPRSFDIVQCVRLLDRINHAELVLDRLVAALKPGGLLLLQISDRDCAAGFLDRVLPTLSRRLLWSKRHPGEPGPYPAVYEPLTSVRGIQDYARLRGLVIAERRPQGGPPSGHSDPPRWYLAVQGLVTRLSRGRLTSAHEEMLYVMRKPENRFARLL
jgi:SAM-dependent methyltransferase